MLLAYTKTTNVAEVLASDLPEDPYLLPELVAYFPPALQERFGDAHAPAPPAAGDHRHRSW